MQIPEIIETKLIPWAKRGFIDRTIVAREHMEQSEMPDGVKLVHRKISGKRVIVKGGRIYGNRRNVSAVYPDLRMHEVEMPRIVCAVQGDVNFQAGNYLLSCKEGNIIVIPPRIPHSGDRHNPDTIRASIGGHSCTLLWITSYKEGVQAWVTIYDGNERKLDSANNFLFTKRRVIQLAHLLIEEISEEKDPLICDGLFVSLVGALRREIRLQHYLRPGLPLNLETESSNKSDFMTEFKKYVQEHLDESLTMERVARGLFMSRAQLARNLCRDADRTFLELLNKYRLKEAKRLLTESNWTARIIAEFIGFKSPAYFNRFFRKQVGCTPIEFRQKSTFSANIPSKSIDSKK